MKKLKTAKFIKNLKGFTGEARLYQLSEPINYNRDKITEYVISSIKKVILLILENSIGQSEVN